MVSENLFVLMILISPALFFLSSVVALFHRGIQPEPVIKSSMAASFLAVVSSVYGGVLVFQFGVLEGVIYEMAGIGFSFRLDPLSLLMFSMIALLGFVVVKFSKNYLDGDPRHGIFMGRLSGTIAAVQLLVLSGNLFVLFLAWVLTSLMLHRLLVFYAERRRAVVAARKKFILARLADLFLLTSFILIYLQYSTGNIQMIFDALKEGNPISGKIETAAVFLALAALLKSAQFPVHSWLLEVMETPTPVSALLHAGLLNAGPFLMVRLAYLIDGAQYAPVILIVFGGLTALVASVSYTTQPSVKIALGYSSAAHMGFMLLIAGIGVYPAVMLHLVAHSFYKAHAFLMSGSAVDTIKSSNITQPKRLGSPIRIAGGILIAFFVYLVFSILWGINPADEFALLATGAIVVMGLAQIIVPALDSDGYKITVLRTLLLTVLVATSFFTLESLTHKLLFSQLPELSQPGNLIIVLISSVLVVFGITVVLQMAAPAAKHAVFWQNLGVHFRNGFYMSALFDRFTGAFTLSKSVGNR